MDSKNTEILGHIRTLIEEQKRELSIIHSEQKLRMPTWLTSVTIKQLTDAGAIVDPDISFPPGIEDRVRKNKCITQKMIEIIESAKTQVSEYYAKIKKTLPQELLNKRVKDFDDDEWVQLGFSRTQRLYYNKDK